MKARASRTLKLYWYRCRELTVHERPQKSTQQILGHDGKANTEPSGRVIKMTCVPCGDLDRYVVTPELAEALLG